MEKNLKIKGTEDTPQVVFDKENNKFSLSGRSLPEDPAEFYQPIILWLEDYAKQPNPSTELHINLEYFNSSSIKQILLIFMLLEEIIKTGKEAKIIWHYNEGDDLMEVKGEEFKSMLTVPFELMVD